MAMKIDALIEQNRDIKR